MDGGAGMAAAREQRRARRRTDPSSNISALSSGRVSGRRRPRSPRWSALLSSSRRVSSSRQRFARELISGAAATNSRSTCSRPSPIPRMADGERACAADARSGPRPCRNRRAACRSPRHCRHGPRTGIETRAPLATPPPLPIEDGRRVHAGRFILFLVALLAMSLPAAPARADDISAAGRRWCGSS